MWVWYWIIHIYYLLYGLVPSAGGHNVSKTRFIVLAGSIFVIKGFTVFTKENPNCKRIYRKPLIGKLMIDLFKLLVITT